jgi:ribonuclease HI
MTISTSAHTLRYIHSRYPTGAWIQVYTDGSATPGKGSAGAGIFCNLSEKSIAAGQYGSNFDGEVTTIWKALEEFNKQQLARKNVVLLIDYVAVIQAVANEDSQNKKVILARYEIRSRQTKGVKVMLQWVSSHCGLIGNEKADYLAKMGSNKKQPPNRISFHSVTAHIKAAVRSQVKNKWNKV